MTSAVFLSGSITITRLNNLMRERLDNIITKGLRVVLGDANGADKAMQRYLADKRYANVAIFCVGAECRNNVGDWPVRHVPAEPSLKGRERFVLKDKAMAAEAAYGFVLWDGKSPGTFGNLLELAEAGKPVVVYFAPEKRFYNVKSAQDVRALLEHCSEADYRSLSQKIPVERRLARMSSAPTEQGSLTF